MSFTTLYITHDLGVVATAAERVGVMYAGQIVEVGGVREIFPWGCPCDAAASCAEIGGIPGDDGMSDAVLLFVKELEVTSKTGRVSFTAQYGT